MKLILCNEFVDNYLARNYSNIVFLLCSFFFSLMTVEEIFARFLYVFLKHLIIELNNLSIIKNNYQSPKKSILRKFRDQKFSFNQNNSMILTQQSESFSHRKVLFTHVDSLEFDPQTPCRFVRLPRRKRFYLSTNDQQMQCLCHHHLKTNKSKIELKH